MNSPNLLPQASQCAVNSPLERNADVSAGRAGIVNFEPASPANHTWSIAEPLFTSEAEASHRQTPPLDGPDLCQRRGRSESADPHKYGSIPPPVRPLKNW